MVRTVRALTTFMTNSQFFKFLVYTSLYVVTFFVLLSVIVFDSATTAVSLLQKIALAASIFFLFKYFIYMMLSPWSEAMWSVWKAKNRAKVAAYQPVVSVLIPAWNEEIGLIATAARAVR